MKHNYPANRKHTGPRPTAGRPAELIEPVVTTIRIEAEDLYWLKKRYGNVSAGIRKLIESEMKKGE